MRDARATRWLLRRLVFGDSRGASLAVLLALVTIGVTMLALASVSAAQVAARHRDREPASTIRTAPGQSSGTADDLRIIDPRLTNSREYGGRDIRREFYVSGSTGAPVPPGLAQTPREGDFFASPDLIALMSTDPVVARLFKPYKLVGRIAPSGLDQPHALKAVIGAEPTSSFLLKVDGFGGGSGTTPEERSDSVLSLSVAAYVAALLWMPTAFLLLIASRLASQKRRRRSAALHLIGYSKASIHALHSMEAAVICLPSIVVACIFYFAASAKVTELPGTSVGFFSSDVEISWGAYGGVGLLVLVVVAWCVSADTSAQIVDRWTAARGQSGRLTRVAAGMFVVGLLLLALPTVASLQGPLTPAALWLAMVLIAFGLAVAGPRLATRLLDARAAARAAPALVGRRMAAYRVTTSLRLSSVLSVLIVLLIGSHAFAGVLAGGSSTSWKRRVESVDYVPVVAVDLAGTARQDEVVRASGTPAVAELRAVTVRGVTAKVAYATCDALARLSGRSRRLGCEGSDRPVWVGREPADRVVAAVNQVGLADGVGAPAPIRTIRSTGLPTALEGSLLLPPGGHRLGGDGGSTFFLVTPSHGLEAALASLSAVDPTMQFDLGELDRHNPDLQQYRPQTQWLTIGALLGIGVTAVALMVAAIGEAGDRGPRMRAMRVLGSSRWDLFIAHSWCVAAPIVLVGLAAIGSGWLVVQAMANIDARASNDPVLMVLALAGVSLTSILVALTSWCAAARPSAKPGAVSA